MGKQFIAVLTLLAAATASAELNKPIRVLEPVVELDAEATELVLGDVGEPIWIISSQDADRLLGDIQNVKLHMLNSMPATAAGFEEVMYIDADSAQKLLGSN